jgi:hypothetical protein
LCAAEYKYDWKTMRRIERVDPVAPNTAGNGRPERMHARKPTWVPRARRLRLQLAARYRVKNLGSWCEGTVENLSQSGVLLRGSQQFPDNALIEMVFEMPEEISGQKNSNVLCQGRVIRSRTPQNAPGQTEMAASILDYKFLRSN